MANKQALDEFFNLWVLIAQTKDAFLKARQREYDRFNITNERRAVLWSIKYYGGQTTPTQIASYLFRELNSVSEILKRMQGDGLIKKHKGSSGTTVIVKMTKKGSEVFDQSLHNESDSKILSVLSKKQREQLASYLWMVRSQALKELGIPEWTRPFPPGPTESLNNAKKTKRKLK
jgi:DNA-binding MarR family transcriptional regulator